MLTCHSGLMTNTSTALTHIEEILDIAGLAEVAYPTGAAMAFGSTLGVGEIYGLQDRPELAGGCGEMWDITLPDEETTIRLIDDDGLVIVYLFTGGRAQIESGKVTFRHRMAAPTYVAMMLEQLVADYS